MDDTVPAQLTGDPEPPASAHAPAEPDAAQVGWAPPVAAHRPAWRALARPRTLVLVAAPVIVTLALLAVRNVPLSLPAAALTLLAALLTQTGANVLDAYLEVERARHSSWLAGTVDHDGHARVLGAHPLAVLRASIVLLALGGAAGVPLIIYGGWPVAVLGAFGLVVAFLYSATTYALKRVPAGELPVFLALGPGLVLATALIQGQRASLDLVLVGCALGLLATVVLELARLRNTALGRVAGGAGRMRLGRWLAAACIAGAYVCVLASALTSLPARGAVLAIFSLPAGLVALTGALAVRSAVVARLAARAALRLYILFATLLVLGSMLPAAFLQLWQAL